MEVRPPLPLPPKYLSGYWVDGTKGHENLVRVDGVLIEIRSGHFRNTTLERCHYTPLYVGASDFSFTPKEQRIKS